MKKYIIIVLVILSAMFFIGFKYVNNKKIDTQIKKQIQFTVSQKISIKEFSKTYDKIKVVEGISALELLQQTTKTKTKGEGRNAFITSINGREADGNKNEFWSFEINGKEAMIGAGSYILKPQDTILWTIKKF